MEPDNQEARCHNFFLLSIVMAGIFGAATAKPTILFTQATPALIAAIAVWWSDAKKLSHAAIREFLGFFYKDRIGTL